MIYFCCDELRRNAVDSHGTLNGIDFLEVLDNDAPAGSPRQRTLLVRCLKPVGALTRDNVRITGGQRISTIGVEWAFPAPDIPPSLIPGGAEQAFFASLAAPADHVLVVRTDTRGDFSIYQLALVDSAAGNTPPANFDPLLSRVSFSFKVECPSEFDCRPHPVCPPAPVDRAEIDYLAKDFSSFRRLILDRVSLLSPQWRARSPADLGIALVELLAFAGDYLSYQQDAIGTEAYLGTARRRVSVRRHARLVDYFMHDGRNARVWVHVETKSGVDGVVLATGTQLLTLLPEQPTTIAPNSQQLQRALGRGPVLFETMHEIALFSAHNEMPFYTWGDERCCLPRGATSATLRGDYPNLVAGDVLIFEEIVGPLTGLAADADSSHRHAVRLMRVTPSSDPAGGRFNDPPSDAAVSITEIEWGDQDALPFPLCISARTDVSHGQRDIDGVSVARGNIVLADHGLTIKAEDLGQFPTPTLFRVATPSEERCREEAREPVFPRFHPVLQQRPLTQTSDFDAAASATAATTPPANTLPAIRLRSQLRSDNADWTPKRDLLSSSSDAEEFVVEVESDQSASIRFGDDINGRRPEPETMFTATYRVGNGPQGNIGAETLAHVVTPESQIESVRNPMPAVGGLEQESIEEVRQRAPHAYRTQRRAVTEDDYAVVTRRHPGIQEAAATFRWTGSWHTAFVTVDRRGGQEVTPQFKQELRQHLEPFRMAGHDLNIDGPRFVPLELEMAVCVSPRFFRSSVRQMLLQKFSDQTLTDGTKGLFHPDNFTFGQTVHLSPLIRAAQETAGVISVEVTVFQRQGTTDPVPLEAGSLELGRLEIAQLDNDPNFPERGVFRLRMGGGK